MTPPTGYDLHHALLRDLQPVTRWRHPFPGDGPPVRVNEHGIDVWENHVGNVHLDPAGPESEANAHAYLFAQTGPGGQAWTRAVAATTVTRWAPILTFAGGTPRKVAWALDQAAPILDGLILTDTSGRALTAPMRQGPSSSVAVDYDPGPLQLDTDPSPGRWFVPIQYATTAH